MKLPITKRENVNFIKLYVNEMKKLLFSLIRVPIFMKNKLFACNALNEHDDNTVLRSPDVLNSTT